MPYLFLKLILLVSITVNQNHKLRGNHIVPELYEVL